MNNTNDTIQVRRRTDDEGGGFDITAIDNGETKTAFGASFNEAVKNLMSETQDSEMHDTLDLMADDSNEVCTQLPQPVG